MPVDLHVERAILLNSQIDHLIITAPDLESGAAFVFETLGIALQGGGTSIVVRPTSGNAASTLVAHIDTPQGTRRLQMGVRS